MVANTGVRYCSNLSVKPRFYILHLCLACSGQKICLLQGYAGPRDWTDRDWHLMQDRRYNVGLSTSISLIVCLPLSHPSKMVVVVVF